MLSKTHTKYIQSLWHKKFRDEKGLFIAEGPKLVLELLGSAHFFCREIFALEQWIKEHGKQVRESYQIEVSPVQDFELKKISSLSTPNQVLGIFEMKVPVTDIKTGGKIVLVLDTIQDPGNLGTIIRIADWFGVSDIVCSTGCADMYNSKVVQSSMGSLGRVNLFYTDLVEWLRQHRQVPVYAASLEGKPVGSLGKLPEAVIVIGNEANGVSAQVMQMVQEKITIPGRGAAESLNAAVATGIILSHISGDQATG